MKKYLKDNWFLLVLALLCISAIVAINAHVLEMTHGCYNVFELMIAG